MVGGIGLAAGAHADDLQRRIFIRGYGLRQGGGQDRPNQLGSAQTALLGDLGRPDRQGAIQIDLQRPASVAALMPNPPPEAMLMNLVHDNGSIVKLRLSPGSSGRAVFPKEIRLPEACRGRTVKQVKGSFRVPRPRSEVIPVPEDREVLAFRLGEGRVGLTVRALRAGGDWVVVVTGGDVPHVGALALAAPGEPPRVLGRPGHREAEPAVPLAGELATLLGAAVAVAVGVHLDAITPSELREVVALLEGVPGELAERLGRGGRRQ